MKGEGRVRRLRRLCREGEGEEWIPGGVIQLEPAGAITLLERFQFRPLIYQSINNLFGFFPDSYCVTFKQWAALQWRRSSSLNSSSISSSIIECNKWTGVPFLALPSHVPTRARRSRFDWSVESISGLCRCSLDFILVCIGTKDTSGTKEASQSNWN